MNKSLHGGRVVYVAQLRQEENGTHLADIVGIRNVHTYEKNRAMHVCGRTDQCVCNSRGFTSSDVQHRALLLDGNVFETYKPCVSSMRRRNYVCSYCSYRSPQSTSLTPIALVSSAAQEAITWVKLSGMSSLKTEAEQGGDRRTGRSYADLSQE